MSLNKMYWVIGGEFTSMNFHSFIPGTTIIKGPFHSKNNAELEWSNLSEKYRSKAQYRFVITEE